MNFPQLFSPVTIGPYQLKHRLALAPLTRMRAEKPSLAPRPLNAEYYAQRATSGGLLIAEASPVAATAFGSPGVPGIYTEAQIEGWRKVVDAVHARGGIIFLQLWHVGRVSHSSFQPGGVLPVAPSAVAIPPDLKTGTADGKLVDYETPRALETSEIPDIVDAFRQAAQNALKARFDGVEIHGANGYLVHQFLADNTNQRTDRYGGSIDNRIRFAVEVAAAVAEEIGADRTGLRISPGNPYNDIAESDTAELYPALLRALSPLGLAYLHILHAGDEELLGTLRALWPTTLILNRAGTDLPTRARDVDSGTADLVSVGALALANPDLVERLRSDAPLNTPDPATFYGGGVAGYTDYPTHTV
jgi:N-ethylmaleimide reductase